MAKLDHYREAIQTVLLEYAKTRTSTSSNSALQIQPIFDLQRDHYQLVTVGWYHDKRVYSPLFHLDIQNKKIWLQLNTTEDDITLDLMRLGVAKEDIVLGFQAPHIRQFTEFSAG
ncbi:MAG: XisI protein [Leptolyngbyaceae cyanobacterium SL_5_9]|nr:XisI protein [Leptolyngbyaceae cyanobacterium SL_5_9]NJO76898.1 XisI protein [Leptolyngbyaceae cyanobacterium RM1_406_9]